MLDKIVGVITEDRQQWVNTMLREEWGLQLEQPSPWRAGLATFVAFLLAGLVPLLPPLLMPSQQAQQSFAASSLLTGVTFFIVGVIRGRVLDRRPWAAGFETLLIGGSAAAVAYVVGKMLERLASA
jgi:VIT1/CCC1 family predicted Fe2+/Mn2+ transporter